MISEIDTTSYVVSEVLEKLVEHYSQDVHNKINTVEQAPPPYFDQLLGSSQVEVPNVIVFWLECLKASDPQCDIIDLPCGYGSHIRPCLIKASVACIQVLEHYELLLSSWLKYRMTTTKFNLSSSDIKNLSHQINLLLSDITAMTSPSVFKCNKYIRCNTAIPLLLRILHHIFSIVSRKKEDEIIFLDKAIMANCVATLLAFDTDRRLDPSVIVPSLFHSNQQPIESICAYPPTKNKNSDFSNYTSFSSINWSSLSLDGIVWNDHNTGILSRAAETVWKDLIDLASINLRDQEESKQQKALICSREEKDILRQNIFKTFDVLSISSAVRLHFFGVNEYAWNSETNVTTSIIMGKRVTKKEAMIKDKAYKTIPSRVHAALSFFFYLSEYDNVVCQQLIPNVLPVCLELIDSSNMTQSALGACALIRLMNMSSDYNIWDKLVDQILPVLDLAFATCRNGCALIVLGQAQSRLLNNHTKGNGAKRRQVTRKWLRLLRQSVDGVASEFTSWDILVGGVIPFLNEHAQLPNADAIEFGRLGLAALLPLIDPDVVDSKTLVATLVALINLLVGAHPIMKHHGGKIMSRVSCAAAMLNDKNYDVDEMIGPKDLAIHTAAVALLVCGGPTSFAGQILHDIKAQSDNYNGNLLENVSEIFHHAACLSK
jgi:hypothetical protein